MRFVIILMLMFLIAYPMINSQENISLVNSNNYVKECPQLDNNYLQEKASPKDRIKEDQILVYKDEVIIKIKDVSWSTYTDTNSMDPIIDKGANGLEIRPESTKDIQLGDIIAYQKEGSKDIIVHRVIEINQDNLGWYVITKGDNNQVQDPYKIRFNEIKYVLVGIIY
ncbi:MAG: signal peptidase I [archaeon]